MKDSKPVEEFKQKLAKLEAERGGGSKPDSTRKQATDQATSIGFRVASDLLAGVLVGLGIGWLLDSWLGTRPWFMIGFFFLGSLAGMLNIWRLLNGYGMEVGYFSAQKKPKKGSD
ncbi:MAG: AtpZ/AtpI family protein [Alphaproteobacteria bacterium]|nr:AtpZ/AtpI family protein [Alphaproteobacteria bacterium]